MDVRAAAVLPSRKDAWWAMGLACALVLSHLPAFTLTPAVNHDEVILNAAARSWTSRGVIALSPLADHGKTYATAYYLQPPGHLLMAAAAYRLFGFSIAVTRGVSLAGGAAAIVLLFAVLRRMGLSRPVAAAATVLFACHPLTWWLCRSGRMDLTALGLGLGAMLLILGDEREEVSAARAAMAGLLLGLGGLFHVLLLFWAPAIVAAETIRLGRVPWRNAALLCALAALPPVLWVAAVFARGDGPAWREQFLGYSLSQRGARGPVWRRVPDEVILFARQFRFAPAMIPILVAGLFCGWRKQQRARWWAAGGAIASFFLIALATTKGTGAYPLYWFVWMLLAAAPGIASLPPKVRIWLLALAMANAAALQFGRASIGLYQSRARDPVRVDRFFATYVRPGSIVLGPEDIWYGVEHAGAQLRIWGKPDPRHDDYYVTYASVPAAPPAGFRLLAELPDIMPKVFGRYWSHTSYSYRIWVPGR